MYYIIPAGSLPQVGDSSTSPQYQVGLDAAGNTVLYLATAAPDQVQAPPVLAADSSLLQPQLLPAQKAPASIYLAPSEVQEEPAALGQLGGMDTWGEPGYLSAPAAFSTDTQPQQHLAVSATAHSSGLTLAPLNAGAAGPGGALAGPHAKLAGHPAPLAPAAAPAPSNTAFLVQQLQQLQQRQQQELQQQRQQQQVRHIQQQLQQQQQQQQQLLVQNQQLKLTPEQQMALTAGQPWQMNSSTQVQRLLSSIAQNNNNRRVDPFKVVGPAGGTRPAQLGQLAPLNRPGPLSAPTKPAGAPKPHHAPLRAQPPSWAGSNWNPRSVGTPAASTGTGVFLPIFQPENAKPGAAVAQPPPPQAAPVPADALALNSGPPSVVSPLDSNMSGSAWSNGLSSNPSVYVEDP